MTIASSPLSLSELEDKIAACGSQIAIAKKDPSKKPSDIEPLVQELLGFKKLYAEALKSSEAEMAAVSRTSFNRAALESLLTKRFFYAPSFQIYGGTSVFFAYETRSS